MKQQPKIKLSNHYARKPQNELLRCKEFVRQNIPCRFINCVHIRSFKTQNKMNFKEIHYFKTEINLSIGLSIKNKNYY